VSNIATSVDSSAHAGAETAAPGAHTHKEGLAKLALGAIGVVFGDIGTSPLYTLRETFTHGSSAERTAWFRRGLESGKVADCNTFARSQ